MPDSTRNALTSLKQEEQYNPLEKRSLAESIAKALLARPIGALPPGARFLGAGIYAIYYFGDCPLYARLSIFNQASSSPIPIYVGKAVPKGARKGTNLEAISGSVLYDRLSEHADSIRSTSNL